MHLYDQVRLVLYDDPEAISRFCFFKLEDERFAPGNTKALSQVPARNASEHATRIRDKLYDELNASKPAEEQWPFAYIDDALFELAIIREMHEGNRHAFHLYIDIILDILQKEHESALLGKHVRYHRIIRTYILEVINDKSKAQGISSTSLIHASRIVRKRMGLAQPCQYGDMTREPASCIHNELLKTLDVLQCHTYLAIRSETRLALTTYLPAELIHIVFEHVLRENDVPLDPRLYVIIRRAGYSGYARITRYSCTHRSFYGPDPEGSRRTWVTKDDGWIESMPNLPHSEIESYGDFVTVKRGVKERDLKMNWTDKKAHKRIRELLKLKK